MGHMAIRSSLRTAWRLGRLAACAWLAPPAPPGERAGGAGRALRVASYNVNWGRAGAPATLAACRRVDADVLCLQELTGPWEQSLRRHLSDAYPHMCFAPHDRGGGLGVLARRPVEPGSWIPPAGGRFPAWIVRLEAPVGDVQILQVHLCPPATPQDRLSAVAFWRTLAVREREVRAFWRHVEPGRPTVVLGDFNEGDWGFALDWLRKRGLRDALSAFAPRRATWASPLGRWRVPWRARLDHILHTPELATTAAGVLWAGASDHVPVWADFAPASRL